MGAKRSEDIEKAIQLRKKGKSVKEICDLLGASKGSVSVWVRSVPQPERFTVEYRHKLKEERLNRLREERRAISEEKLKNRIIKNKYVNKEVRIPKDKLISGDGRWMVRAHEGYQGKKYIGSRYVYEHRLIIERKIGRLLLPDEVVHHINGNKLDNREENLEIKNKYKHTSDHQPKAKILKLTCDWCGKEFDRPEQVCTFNASHGYKHKFCCLSHSVSFQQKERWKNNIPW